MNGSGKEFGKIIQEKELFFFAVKLVFVLFVRYEFFISFFSKKFFFDVLSLQCMSHSVCLLAIVVVVVYSFNDVLNANGLYFGEYRRRRRRRFVSHNIHP